MPKRQTMSWNFACCANQWGKTPKTEVSVYSPVSNSSFAKLGFTECKNCNHTRACSFIITYTKTDPAFLQLITFRPNISNEANELHRCNATRFCNEVTSLCGQQNSNQTLHTARNNIDAFTAIFIDKLSVDAVWDHTQRRMAFIIRSHAMHGNLNISLYIENECAKFDAARVFCMDLFSIFLCELWRSIHCW